MRRGVAWRVRRGMALVQETPYERSARLKQKGRPSGPPGPHSEAGNPTRCWPKADPAVTEERLMELVRMGNACFQVLFSARPNGKAADSGGR
jgi:hypothetical protein